MRTGMAVLGLVVGLSGPVHGDAMEDWHIVNSWDGAGIQTTAAFTVTSRDWVIGWNAVSSGSTAGLIGVMVYDDATGQLLDVAVNSPGGYSGTTTEHLGPGRYWLEINAANVRYTVRVQDYR